MHATPLRRLRRQLVLLVAVYCVAGAASQKLVPGVDEIFPFFGWSLFSKVPNLESRYTVVIHRHEGQLLRPPVSFFQAPGSIVTGNRFLGRKLIQSLGRAHDKGRTEEADHLRQVLEDNYLQGKVRYDLLFERYEPLHKWQTGESSERRLVVRLDTRDPNESPK